MRKTKFYTFVAALFCATAAMGQSELTPLAVGSTVPNISMTDIEGNTFSLYDYLDEGYTLVIDMSATWCPPCWSFHETKAFENLYEKYGPEGTVTPKKIMPIFIEGDDDTDMSDLLGETSASQGNWVEGAEYHIVDIGGLGEIIGLFEPVSGSVSVAFPTFWTICPDKKVVMSQRGGGGDATQSNFIALAGECNGATGITEIIDQNSVLIYPNPAEDQVHLSYTASASSKASITVTSVTGQVLINEAFNMVAGSQQKSINIAALASGIYVVTLTTESGDTIRKKITKK